MAAQVVTSGISCRTNHDLNLSAFVNPNPASNSLVFKGKNFNATVCHVVEDGKSGGAVQFRTAVDIDVEECSPKGSTTHDRKISDMPMLQGGITVLEQLVNFSKSAFLDRRMEKSEEMVVLSLLMERNYRACTIPFRFPSDNPKKPTPAELSWINLFANSIPSFRKRAEIDDTVPDAPARAEKFAQRYTEILEDLKVDIESHGGPPDCLLLCKLRDQVLREVGFRDIFKEVKDEENAKAISIFQDVVHLNDAIEDEAKRMENLIRGIFAGNIFDLGSAQLAELFAKDGMSFQATCQNLVPRPWAIDNLDEFISKWARKSWKKVVIFVDNSGADVILGVLPFARELLRHGVQVVLAANDLPSINDITYLELIQILAKLKDENGKLLGVDTSDLFIVNSGNDLPVIDLTRVSQEVSYLASDADLVILEGMGRGIETNLYAQFKCDSLKIAMVKHLEVAQFLGGRLYDCVFKYNECRD